MTEFNQDKFESDAKKLVAKYLNYKVDEKDVIDEKDVSIVWFSKIVKNAKATLSSELDHRYRYFDVTYFGKEGVYILDVYRLVGWDEFHEEEL